MGRRNCSGGRAPGANTPESSACQHPRNCSNCVTRCGTRLATSLEREPEMEMAHLQIEIPFSEKGANCSTRAREHALRWARPRRRSWRSHNLPGVQLCQSLRNLLLYYLTAWRHLASPKIGLPSHTTRPACETLDANRGFNWRGTLNVDSCGHIQGSAFRRASPCMEFVRGLDHLRACRSPRGVPRPRVCPLPHEAEKTDRSEF